MIIVSSLKNILVSQMVPYLFKGNISVLIVLAEF